MKFFHISDLHIGKQLHSYDILELQKDVLAQIVSLVKEHRPDALVVAGDIYDRTAPSGEAFGLLNWFLNALADIEPSVPVLMIAGNHDSGLRLGFAGSFLERHGIHIAAFPPRKEEEYLKKITLRDEYGDVNFYLLPYVRPADAKNLFGEKGEMYTDQAVRLILEREEIDDSRRNVLVAHQFFVSGGKEPERRESELRYISVGGLDSVDTGCVEVFDYVALGHLHSSQSIGKDYIRYSGTPMKYSVSEADDKKGITVVQLMGKGEKPRLDFLPLVMKPDVRKIRGSLQEVIKASDKGNRGDYVSVTLTDEEALFRPKDRLMEFYDRLIEVKIDNSRTAAYVDRDMQGLNEEDPLKLFCDFYQEMNGQPVSDSERKVLTDIIDSVRSEVES